MAVPGATGARPIDWGSRTTIDEREGKVFTTKVCAANGEKIDIEVSSSPVHPTQSSLGGVHVSLDREKVHLVLTRGVDDGPVTGISISEEGRTSQFYRGPDLFDESARVAQNSRYFGFRDTGEQLGSIEGRRPQPNEVGAQHVLSSDRKWVHVFTPLAATTAEGAQARALFSAADALAGKEVSVGSCQALYTSYQALVGAKPQVVPPNRQGWRNRDD